MHVLIVVLIISFLVIIHELGHFFAARKTKTNAQEFGLGYPPRLIKLFTYQGTDFTLNLIPFGGFVRLEGEMGPELEMGDQMLDQENQNSIQKLQKNVEEELAIVKKHEQAPFYQKTAFQRGVVILSGAIVNILFALIAFSIVFSFMGIPTSLINQARIGEIAPNSPAEDAGLPESHNIIEINAQKQSFQIDSFVDVQRVVSENRGKTIEVITVGPCENLKCDDERQSFNVYIRTVEETPENQGALGVGFIDVIFAFYPWYEMPVRGSWHGVQQAVGLGWMILRALGETFVGLFSRGELPQDMAGPIGIVHEAQRGNIISSDFLSNLGFAGMLSLNLAIINLLPIPALDGGRAVFILLEKLIGRRRIHKIEGYANYGGFVILIILIVAITIKDVGRIIG